MMPEMDGFELARRVRALGVETPLVLLTANALAANEKAYQETGFQDFLIKPIETEKLEACLSKLLPAAPQVAPQDPQTESPAAAGGTLQTTYALSTPELLETMRSKEGVDYIIAVHGLKGASRVVGASSIADRATELEHAARTGNWSLVHEKNAALIADTESFIQTIAVGAGPRARPLSPDSPNPATLKKILQAAEDFDMDKIRLCIAELGPCALAQNLKSLVLLYDYDGIAKLVKSDL
jgi:CheY-like chemotaxis protein